MSSPDTPRSGQLRPKHRRRRAAEAATPGPGITPSASAPGTPSGPAATPGGHRYLFDHVQDGELARLQAIEAVCDRWTIDVLQRAGLQADWRCLDAGAGAGSIARWLAQRMGPAGQVVAADADTRFVEPLASGTLRAVRHDLRHGPPEPGGFDLVHARFLLEWLPGWEQALDHLVASVKPGGTIVISDMAWGSRIPAQGVLERWISAIPAALREVSGYHPDCGRLLPGALESRRIRVDGAEARAALLNGASPGMDWPRLSVQPMTAPMLRMGLADQASLRAVSELLADPATRLWLPPMVSVWGRRELSAQDRSLDSPSLQLATHRVSTPVNWHQGEPVIIAGSVSNDPQTTSVPHRCCRDDIAVTSLLPAGGAGAARWASAIVMEPVRDKSDQFLGEPLLIVVR